MAHNDILKLLNSKAAFVLNELAKNGVQLTEEDLDNRDDDDLPGERTVRRWFAIYDWLILSVTITTDDEDAPGHSLNIDVMDDETSTNGGFRFDSATMSWIYIPADSSYHPGAMRDIFRRLNISSLFIDDVRLPYYLARLAESLLAIKDG